MISLAGQSSTILIIREHEVMRADVRGDRVTQLARESRPTGTPLLIAVELACGLTEKKLASETYVVADDFWTGVIDLDERSIYGLEGDDLEQMLRYETESLSDIDPSTSRLGFVELSSVPPDTRRFWGIAVSSEVLTQVAQAVRLRGGKLQLLASPLGISCPDPSGAAWVEFTPELAGAFAAPADSDEYTRAFVTPRSATSDRWFQALGTMFGGDLPQIGWLASPQDQPPYYDGQLEVLSDDAVARRWVEGLVKRVTNAAGFPHIDAPQMPVSGKALVKIGVSAAVITATFLVCIAFLVHSQISDLKTRTAQLKGPQQERKRLDQSISKLSEEIEKLREDAQQAADKRENLRLLVDNGDRFAVLLQTLAKQAESSLVIDGIKPERQGITLRGRSIRSDAVTQLVQRLEPELARIGWSVRPASVDGTNQTLSGGPWTFTVELVDMPTIAPQDQTDPKLSAAVTATRRRATASF